jgi:3-phosphoshikimate 1-carboxyvinyltransferase
MRLIVEPSVLQGEVTIPGSKSHTIRSLVVSMLASGESVIHRPLDSSDTRSCLAACRALGATVEEEDHDGVEAWRVYGTGGSPGTPENVIDVGNSGTTLRLVASAAALAPGYTVLTGDYQIRRRPMEPLLKALKDLGATAFSTRPGGRPPVAIAGPFKGGSTRLEGLTSQYVSSLLLTAPLATEPVTIDVVRLNEQPYVEMTLQYLRAQDIQIDYEDLHHYEIAPGQRYRGMEWTVPADYSSATFFIVAAAVLKQSRVVLMGLDPDDVQGDKAVIDMLRRMGADIAWDTRDGRPALVVSCRGLQGGEFDLNATPDALPALAVAGAVAEGETRLTNVPQARVKECDRIEAMCTELRKMGVDIAELDDGLVIRKSELRGATLDGHDDHRVVMALAVAAMAADSETFVESAEAIDVTFPDYIDLMTSLGGALRLVEEEM